MQKKAPTKYSTANRVRSLLQDPPGPLLLRMASPNAFAFLLQAAVSMAEVWFISQLGVQALASIALVFPLLMLMQMLSVGAMGGAVASAIARALGADKLEKAEKLIWHALLIAVTAGGLFFLLNAWVGRDLLVLLGGSGAVLNAAEQYLGVLFAGCGAIWLTAILSSLYRGMGDMKLPALVMIISAALQIIVSGMLVLGWFGAPQMGIAGVAISVIGVSVLASLGLAMHLASGRALIRLKRKAWHIRSSLFWEILKVGSVSSLSPFLTVATVLGLTSIIARYGDAALAGYGIGSRLEFLLVPLVFGIGAAMTTMVGVNVGAGQIDRAERIGWTGGLAAATLAGSIGIVLALFPGLWLNLFTNDQAIYAAGAGYLSIVAPVFAFQGFGVTIYFASQGAAHVMWPIIATLLRLIIAVGGGAYAYSTMASLDTLYIYISVSIVCFGLLTGTALKLGAWRRA